MNIEERKRKIESYGAAHEILMDAIGRFPKEMWHFRPSPDQWTIHEIIVHITDSEANSYVRCRRFIAERGESVMAYDEMQWARALDYQTQSAEDAAELFKWLRRTSYDLIKNQPESVWAHTIYHPENGIMTMDDWLETYERHVSDHIEQMRDVYRQWLSPKFYPTEAVVPAELRTAEFVLRPLRTTHVELDYDAVMTSREMLHRWGGGPWPADDFPLEGNLADLAEHQKEHEQRVAFTYTVLNPEGTECLGCVYIMPFLSMQRWMAGSSVAETDDFTAVCRFWARQSRLADGLDGRLFDALQVWFDEAWAFRQVYFRANENDTRQRELFTDAGLSEVYTLKIGEKNGQFLLYGGDW
ncbi:MAG: DinB family protein [Candidatus Promineifilaceae bacterium]